jgi:hypothetical protein
LAGDWIIVEFFIAERCGPEGAATVLVEILILRISQRTRLPDHKGIEENPSEV